MKTIGLIILIILNALFISHSPIWLVGLVEAFSVAWVYSDLYDKIKFLME